MEGKEESGFRYIIEVQKGPGPIRKCLLHIKESVKESITNFCKYKSTEANKPNQPRTRFTTHTPTTTMIGRISHHRQSRFHRPGNMQLAITISLFFACLVSASEDDLITLINRLNSDVIELRNEVESSIATRCETIAACYKSSYDECQSEMPAEQSTCPSVDKLGFAVSECGQGKSCNALFSYDLTTVRLPESVVSGPNRNPTNPGVSVCVYL